MAGNKIANIPPIALTTTLTTNILNPPTATGGVNGGSSANYILMKHIHLVNKTTQAATVSFWLGASNSNVAGTEVLYQGVSIPANGYLDWFGMKRIDSTQYLVGGSNTASAISMEIEGEIGVAG
jgi:hypothetical protein